MIIVTGASGGIGQELIPQLTKLDQVIGIYNSSKPKSHSVPNVTYVQLDITDSEEVENFIENWNSNGGNLILITHYVIITAITDAVPRSGEIVITDKNFKVLSTIKTLP